MKEFEGSEGIELKEGRNQYEGISTLISQVFYLHFKLHIVFCVVGLQRIMDNEIISWKNTI